MDSLAVYILENKERIGVASFAAVEKVIGCATGEDRDEESSKMASPDRRPPKSAGDSVKPD